MKSKRLPISRAKTAWGLLLSVKRAILEEPKRIRMSLFIGVKGDNRRASNEDFIRYPACGTVGCFAGWVAICGGLDPRTNITDGEAQMLLGQDLNYYTVRDRPARTDQHFNDYVFNTGGGDACANTKPGTKAHAKAVVARITKFMQVNEVALKARKLPKVNPTANTWRGRVVEGTRR